MPIASVSVLLMLLVSASCALAGPVTELKITPENPCAYDGNITITGKVDPNEIVTITTTYVKEVNVTDGKYEYDPGIVPIPEVTTFCSISAESVEDITISTNLSKYLPLPISRTQEASSGKAAISVSSPFILPGEYSLLISGNAADTKNNKSPVKTVAITFVAKMDVKADEKGYLEQVCSTNRPAGNYTLKIGNETRVVNLRDCSKDDKSNTTVPKSGGTGYAKVSGIGNATVNASVLQSVLDTENYGPEDVPDVAEATTTAETPANTSYSIMDIIRAILKWLGF
jgi:hypothetical protein